MDRKERILAYIKSKEYIPLKSGELMTVLDVPKEAEAELLGILNELYDEGKIYITKKGRYMPVDGHVLTVKGKLRCNAKGFFGFLIPEEEGEEDVFIPGEMMGYALDGDSVLVKIDEVNLDNRHRSGHVIKVLERANKTIIGVIYKEKEGTYRLRPDKRQIYAKVRIKPEDTMGAVIGDRAAAEITQYTDNGKLYGRVVSVLGAEDSLKGCIEGIIMGSGIPYEFSDAAVRAAKNTSETIKDDELQGRTDLRNQIIFTIDGDNARDFDDAVSLTVLENGNYYLGVHIADVSHYVTPGSPLDEEAYKRGTSVYLADRVIPMLPEELSNGICSLNPNVDRLTLSAFMEINSAGEVVRHSLEKSVIRSKERMTYHNVTALLTEEPPELAARYKSILPTLKLMRDLAEVLYKRREKRGAIQFDFPETEVIVDEYGEPVEIVKAERGISNGIIEEFMLCANETIAEYAFWAELPFIYRVHEPPSPEKIIVFNDFIRNFGLTIRGGQDGEVHPKALQQVLDSVKGTPEERMVASKMLRSLMKAEYKAENLGHFGLTAKYYCHFTSPIRRYPDLAIHRVLKSFIDGKPQTRTDFEKDAGHLSECEITAEQTERDVEELMKAAYMSYCIGESFEGIVSNITSFGMFVELQNSIEGLVRVENMSDDYYAFDEISGTLTGKDSQKTYKIGDCVKITVVHADILARQIDFVLEKDAHKGVFKKFEKKRSIPKKIAPKRKYGKKSKFIKKKKKR